MAKNKTNPVVSYVFDRYLCVSRSITSLFLPSGSLTLTLTLTLTKFRLVCTPLGKNIVGSFFWSYRCLVLKKHYFVICHAHIDCSKRRIDHGRTRTRTSRFRRKWATTSRGGTGKLRVYNFLKEPQNTFLGNTPTSSGKPDPNVTQNLYSYSQVFPPSAKKKHLSHQNLSSVRGNFL